MIQTCIVAGLKSIYLSLVRQSITMVEVKKGNVAMHHTTVTRRNIYNHSTILLHFSYGCNYIYLRLHNYNTESIIINSPYTHVCSYTWNSFLIDPY